MIEINPEGGIPIFEQIANAIEHKVLTAQLSEGELIPSVRELAVELKVNPNTVSKAYQSLKTKGLVSFERGIGLRVCSVEKNKANERREDILTKSIRETFELGWRLGFTSKQIQSIATHIAKEHKS